MNKDAGCSANSQYNSQWFEWLALIVVFLLAGTIGHDPWKQDETYSFGIIYHFYTTHTWLVPTNAGMPFMEKPPLYYWSAVLFCKLFSGILPLPDAARLTSFFYMLVTIVFTWKLSQNLFHEHPERRAMGWAAIALLLGSIGLVRHAHDMFTDVALLTGTTITLFGMSLLTTRQECWKQAGFWLGIGIGIAFMSKGLLTPAILGISGIALWCILPELRTRKTFGAISIALVVVSPFLFIWPALLYQYSPALFIQWLWENNIGRFFGFSVHHLGASNKSGYFLYTVLWFAFPVLPLACITVIADRADWRKPEYLLPISVIVSGMVLLLASASARALYLIPLLPACTMLAVKALWHVPTRFLAGLNVIARVLFSFGAVLIWLVWWSLPQSAHDQLLSPLLNYLGQWLPLGFVPPLGNHWAVYISAIVITLFWLFSLRFKGNTPVNTARIGFTGVVVLWGLTHTLLLPWINETRSYRTVVTQMSAFVRQMPHVECISNFALGESISPMIQYFGNLQIPMPLQDFDNSTCPLLLVSIGKSTPENIDSRWKMIWRGSRALDKKNQELRLYARKK